MTVGDTNTLTFRWLAGILMTVVFTMLAFWARDVSASVGALNTLVREQSIETAVIRGSLMETNARLKRIENNQDADAMIRRRR